MDFAYLLLMLLNLLLGACLVFLVILGSCAGIILGDQILHEHIQTITVAQVDVFSHQVIDTEGTVWTLHLTPLEMQLMIRPGDTLTLSWQGGVWFAETVSDADVISSLRAPSSLTNTTCVEAAP